MIEVCAQTKDGREISALHTDSAARALHFSKVMNDNGHYDNVFVVVGSAHLTHQEFVNRLGATSNGNDQSLYR